LKLNLTGSEDVGYQNTTNDVLCSKF